MMGEQEIWRTLDKGKSNRDDDLAEKESKRKTIRNELCDLGLTTNEAEIYILIAQSENLKASEVSKYLKIPKTETYLTLKELMNKNIIREISGRPVRFQALPFEDTFRNLINNKRNEIKGSEISSSPILDLWKTLPPRIIEETEQQQFQKLLGLNRIYSKFKDMIQKVKNELIIMASSEDLKKMELYGLFEDIRIVLDNEVDVTIITDNEQNLISTYKYLNIVQFSTKEEYLPNVILVDQDEILSITNEDILSKETLAFWTNCTTLCIAIKLFFTFEYSHKV